MAQIDPQYIIKQIERVQKAVKYQNAKAERQIIKARKQHERHLRWTDEGLGSAMAAFETYAVKESAPIDDESIVLLDKNEGEMDPDALEQTIMQIRDKADQMIKAARKHCAMRCWTCADDGLAHPFEYRGKNYYRTYSGTMWHEGDAGQLDAWAGVWNGKYIGKGEEPQQKPPVA